MTTTTNTPTVDQAKCVACTMITFAQKALDRQHTALYHAATANHDALLGANFDGVITGFDFQQALAASLRLCGNLGHDTDAMLKRDARFGA